MTSFTVWVVVMMSVLVFELVFWTWAIRSKKTSREAQDLNFGLGVLYGKDGIVWDEMMNGRL